MNDSKLSVKECISLTLIGLITNSILSLITNLTNNTRSAIFINLIYVGSIALLISLLIVNLFKNFPRFRYN